jgi:hypothetical protein
MVYLVWKKKRASKVLADAILYYHSSFFLYLCYAAQSQPLTAAFRIYIIFTSTVIAILLW